MRSRAAERARGHAEELARPAADGERVGSLAPPRAGAGHPQRRGDEERGTISGARGVAWRATQARAWRRGASSVAVQAATTHKKRVFTLEKKHELVANNYLFHR